MCSCSRVSPIDRAFVRLAEGPVHYLYMDDSRRRAELPLVILKAENLEAAEAAVKAAGGTITRAIFSFPGGRRFHFREPGGNELGVWSEK